MIISSLLFQVYATPFLHKTLATRLTLHCKEHQGTCTMSGDNQNVAIPPPERNRES